MVLLGRTLSSSPLPEVPGDSGHGKRKLLATITMSSYWKPEWHREIVLGTPRSDLEAAEAELAAARKRGLAPTDSGCCVRADGLIRMAIVGPDWTGLVSAVDRLHVAELQQRV